METPSAVRTGRALYTDAGDYEDFAGGLQVFGAECVEVSGFLSLGERSADKYRYWALIDRYGDPGWVDRDRAAGPFVGPVDRSSAVRRPCG